MHSVFRVYFFRNGVELKDHPLNGSEWSASGSWVVTPDGKMWKGYRTNLTVRRGNNWIKVTRADFPQFEAGSITVKMWAPNNGSEWFKLVHPPVAQPVAN